jgi:hypothetical protein
MKLTKQLFSLCLFIVLAGCSPRDEKIDGSIFIVTKGGENFKLGLVTVSIFDKQQIEPLLTKATTDLEKTIKELRAQLVGLNEKQDKAASARNALRQQYENADDLADEILKKIGGDSNTRPEYTKMDEDALQSQIDHYNTAEGDELKSIYRDEMEKTKEEKQKVLETETNWDTLRPDYLKQVDEKNRLHQAWQNASDESDLYAQTIGIVTGRIQNWQTEQPQIYFSNLPIPPSTAKTDADGKFSLQITKKGEFILVAQAQRQVSDNTEKYFWIIHVHPDGKPEMQIMLSNDNLITANSPEVAVSFPTP